MRLQAGQAWEEGWPTWDQADMASSCRGAPAHTDPLPMPWETAACPPKASLLSLGSHKATGVPPLSTRPPKGPSSLFSH